jgi:hypothetical protein
VAWSSGNTESSIGDTQSSFGSANAAVSRIVDRRLEIAGHPSRETGAAKGTVRSRHIASL